jgi:hypothetical protein
VKEYDILVPLYYNDGSPIEAVKFQRLHTELLEHFDGFTFCPQANEGFWKLGGVTYRDEIVIYRVLTGRVRAARHFLKRLKERLKRDLKQEEILIVERDVETL